MKLWLHRLYLRRATCGVLELEDGFVLATLEDTFKGNGPDSCVPEGSYQLVPHSGPKYRDTWALVGATVSHQPAAGKARSAILFHGGDTVEDTRGCILVGREHYYAPRPEHDVDLSGGVLAMQALRAHLAGEREHVLYIQRG
jgi:hypothetical protein